MSLVAHGQYEYPEVEFNEKNVPLNQALLSLRQSYDFEIAYDNRQLSRYRVSGDKKKIALDKLLERWLEPIGYGFDLYEETIVVYRKEDELGGSDPKRFFITVSGQVVDDRTNEPLPYASISIAGIGQGVAANERGYFQITEVPNDTTTLVCNFVGFDTQRIQLSPETDLDNVIFRASKSHALLPVARVLTFREGGVIQSTRPSLLTIDTELAYELPNVGEPDIIRAIQLLPGVSGALENSAALHVRGGASDENLILFDGFTIYHLDHFFGVFSAFNSNSIKNIRLHKGVFDPRFGGRASSVLEVTGKTGNNLKTDLKANLNLLSASMHIESPILGDRASLMVSARRSYTDVLYSPLYQTLFNGLYANVIEGSRDSLNVFGTDEQPDFRFHDITAKVSVRTRENDQLSFSFYNGLDRLSTGYEEQTIDERFLIQYNDRSQWGNTGVSGQWSRQWRPGHFSSMTVGFSQFGSELFGFDRRENLFVGSVDTVFFDRNTSIRDFTTRFRHEWQKGGHQLTAGFELNALSVENSRLESTGESGQIVENGELLALFVSDVFQSRSGWEVAPGVRTSYFGVAKRLFHEPRLRVSKRFMGGWSLHAAAGRHYQFIRNARRQDLFLNTSDQWHIANEGVVPVLTNDQATLGIQYANELWKITAEGFYKDRKGVIEDALRLINAEADNENDLLIGDGIAYGGEIQITKTKGVHSGWAAYTYARTINQFSSLEEQEIPSVFDRTHEVKAVYMYKPGRFHANAVFVYSSGLPYTAANGVYSLGLVNDQQIELLGYDQIHAARLPNYHRVDLSFYYDFPLKNANASIGLSLYNMYGRANVRNRYYYLVGTFEESLSVEPRDQLFLRSVPAIQLSLEW